MRHGFDTVPPDLLAAIVERAVAVEDMPTPGVRSETRTSGDVTRSRAYAEAGARWSVAATAVLDRYRVS